MSLKDNLSQAVRELIKKDGLVGDDLKKEESKKTELDRYLDSPSGSFEQQKPQQSQKSEEPAQNTSSDNYTSARTETQQKASDFSQNAQSTARREIPRQPAPRPMRQSRIDEPYEETDEITVISRNTIIEGNIRSFANVNIDGSIKGDVQITKNANISGKVVGNLECNNAAMTGSQMQGDVISKGQVKFDRDSLILGNISASYLEMNGKVKGNIDINGKAEFKSDSYIIGDINVASLTVLEGATISGHVNTTYLSEPPTTVFPEVISMTDLG